MKITPVNEAVTKTAGEASGGTPEGASILSKQTPALLAQRDSSGIQVNQVTREGDVKEATFEGINAGTAPSVQVVDSNHLFAIPPQGSFYQSKNLQLKPVALIPQPKPVAFIASATGKYGNGK